MPRIDKNLYARETAGAISGYRPITTSPPMQGAGDCRARGRHGRLTTAPLRNGGFRHGEKDRGGPFLGVHAGGWAKRSSISMPATGNRDWLTSAAKAAISSLPSKDEAGGFVTSKTSEAKPAYWPNRQADRRPSAGRTIQ